MNKLIVLLGVFCLSAIVWAQATHQETGWRASVRPVLTKVFGEKRTNSLIGEAPQPPLPVLNLPELPKLERNNTDASVYKMDSELRRQGAEFDALPAARKRSYEVAFLKELFQSTRRAPAREEDLARWLNVLEGGGTREGVYRGVVLDEVYASLESYEEKPSERLLSWTEAFTKKYLGLTFSKEALEQGNLFSIKRIVTEKVLEMLDALESNPDSFRRWYAVFSAQIGSEYPNIWRGTIRANPNPEVHLNWAQKAHIQHIKSETIIKLQTVLNGLQDA